MAFENTPNNDNFTASGNTLGSGDLEKKELTDTADDLDIEALMRQYRPSGNAESEADAEEHQSESEMNFDDMSIEELFNVALGASEESSADQLDETAVPESNGDIVNANAEIDIPIDDIKLDNIDIDNISLDDLIGSSADGVASQTDEDIFAGINFDSLDDSPEVEETASYEESDEAPTEVSDDQTAPDADGEYSWQEESDSQELADEEYADSGDDTDDGEYFDGGDDTDDGEYFDGGDAADELDDEELSEDESDALGADDELEDFFTLASKQAEELPSGIDPTDINLMVAFGLEDELEKTMGADAAKRLKQAIDAEQDAHDEKKRREYEYEYTDRSQINGIVEAYKSTRISTAVKLLISAFFAILLFFYENITLFGVQFAGALDPAVYPVVYTMVGLQLLLLCCACAYEQIFGGFAKLFTGHPSPESITSIAVLLSVIYSALVAINVNAGYEPRLFNFPIALTVVFTLVFSYCNLKREIYSFNIVSSKRPKYAVSRRVVNDITVYGGDESDEMNEILEVKRLSFVQGYFSRTYADSSVVSATVAIVCALAVAAAALIGVFVGITSKDLMETLEAVFITFVSAIPVSVLLTYSYPFLCANKRANSEGSTIIGEVSLEEYADSSVVTLADKIIFPSTEVKVQNIRIYNNNRIDSVLYYVSSVFSKAGGPLSDVFNLSTVETGHSENVEITENAVGCLSATVDGHLLVFGRVDELAERGLQISDEITDEDSYLAGENSVMYMFIDGVLGAKMFIRYSIDPDFAEIAESLAQDGMSLCIETQDPNIDDKTVSAHIMIDEFPVKVLKTPVGTSNDNVCEELDSGIVARGSADALLRTVTYCNKILRVRKTDFSIGVFGMLTAVAAVFVLALLGKLDVVSSLLVAIYQLIWMLPVLITSKLFIK